MTHYVPGVCNIGDAEIARRRRGGWVGLGLTVAVLLILFWSGVNPWWRLLVFLPATASAAGFLQAHLRFCSGFSRTGIFNFGEVGETREVGDEDDLARDRRRGNQIMIYAALIGSALTIVAVAVG